MFPRPRSLSLRLMCASHAPSTISFGSPYPLASIIPTSNTNATKRHNAPHYTHDQSHPPHTPPPITQTQLTALHSTLLHQYHPPTINRPTITTFTSDDLPLYSPTHPPSQHATSLATTLDMVDNDGTLFGIHDPQLSTPPLSTYWTNALALWTAFDWQGDTRAPYTFQSTHMTPPTATPSSDESDASMPDLESVSSTCSLPPSTILDYLHTYPILSLPILNDHIPPPIGWSGALRARGGGPKVDPGPTQCQVCCMHPLAPHCFLDARQPDEACHPDMIVPSCQSCYDTCNPPTNPPTLATPEHTHRPHNICNRPPHRPQTRSPSLSIHGYPLTHPELHYLHHLLQPLPRSTYATN